MAIIAGIVGITNIGKTTIFNALTSSEVQTSNYSFSSSKANHAVVNVPDNRIEEIFAHTTSNRKYYNALEIMDIAGLVRGASRGEGLGNSFLGDIKMVDAILHVVRCFEDDNIVHVDKTISPSRDIETIETELMIKDLDTIENRMRKNEKFAKSGNKEVARQQEICQRLKTSLENLEHPRALNLTADELENIADMNLLSIKKVIFVANIGEDELTSGNESDYTKAVKDYAASIGSDVIVICGKVEEEISLLPDEDKAEFLKDYGLEEPVLNLLIRKTYDMLGLSTFITEGEIEVRAWNIKKGMTAPQAAGVIHTDFEKKFIKAEVISYDDFKKCDFDRNKAKAQGIARLEGKEYLVQDGDVIIFKVGK